MSKKGILISGLIVLVGGFVAYEQFNPGQQNNNPVVAKKQTPPTGGNNPNPPPGGYKNGTFVGDLASSIFGNAQAEVVISGGQITDVTYLQYPQGRMASMQKSNMAMPAIRQEVIQA